MPHNALEGLDKAHCGIPGCAAAPVAMRSTNGCCSALWKVTKGRASAPPAVASNTGVSTCRSRQPCVRAHNSLKLAQGSVHTLTVW